MLFEQPNCLEALLLHSLQTSRFVNVTSEECGSRPKYGTGAVAADRCPVRDSAHGRITC